MNSAPDDFRQQFCDELRQHEPAARAWLRQRFPALTCIDDLMQETYARLLVAYGRSLGERRHIAKSLFFTTARNLALDQLRRQQLVTMEPLPEKDTSSMADDTMAIAEVVSLNEELELLSNAIQSLPERCRQVLTLRKLYGMSQKEIAAQLDISVTTVETQVRLGTRRCAEYLAKFHWR